jgi:mono/diheme cytochrome c family protein
MRGLPLLLCVSLITGALATVGLARATEGETGMTGAHDNYEDFCAKCHGEDGKGNGPAAATLNPKPRDYTDCKTMAGKSDDELFKVISEGGEASGMSPDMQPWGGTISDEEIHELVKYVRSFCKKP